MRFDPHRVGANPNIPSASDGDSTARPLMFSQLSTVSLRRFNRRRRAAAEQIPRSQKGRNNHTQQRAARLNIQRKAFLQVLPSWWQAKHVRIPRGMPATTL